RAPRLMLHASALALPGLDVKSALPPEFRAWLEGKPTTDDQAIAWAIQKRFALTRSTDTNAFRLLHEDGDGIRGLAVDVLDSWFVAHLYEGTHEGVLERLRALGPTGIYVKDRSKNGSNHRLIGEPAPSPLVIREDGLEYL